MFRRQTSLVIFAACCAFIFVVTTHKKFSSAETHHSSSSGEVFTAAPTKPIDCPLPIQSGALDHQSTSVQNLPVEPPRLKAPLKGICGILINLHKLGCHRCDYRTCAPFKWKKDPCRHTIEPLYLQYISYPHNSLKLVLPLIHGYTIKTRGAVVLFGTGKGQLLTAILAAHPTALHAFDPQNAIGPENRILKTRYQQCSPKHELFHMYATDGHTELFSSQQRTAIELGIVNCNDIVRQEERDKNSVLGKWVSIASVFTTPPPSRWIFIGTSRCKQLLATGKLRTMLQMFVGNHTNRYVEEARFPLHSAGGVVIFKVPGTTNSGSTSRVSSPLDKYMEQEHIQEIVPWYQRDS